VIQDTLSSDNELMYALGRTWTLPCMKLDFSWQPVLFSSIAHTSFSPDKVYSAYIKFSTNGAFCLKDLKIMKFGALRSDNCTLEDSYEPL